MSSIYSVTSNGLGKRGHFAASVHGTEGRALPFESGMLLVWNAAFDWPSNQKPLFIVKIFGEGGLELGAPSQQILRAQQSGMKACLQIRDDEPAGRPPAEAVALTRGILNAMRADGVKPDVLAYLNEPEFNNKQMTRQENAALMAHVYWECRDLVDEFALGNFATWQMLPQQLGFQVAALNPLLYSRIAFVGTHHYNGQPSLPIELGYPELIESIFPHAPLAMSEGDHAATGGPFDEEIWSNRGAAFAVDHNLTLAEAGVYCCDYTLQTSGSGNGNGFFRSNGSPLPSGAAMLQIVAPFLRSPMMEVTRETPYDSTSLFVNQLGEFVVTNHVADVELTIKKWMNMTSEGQPNDHIKWKWVWQWLIGLRQAPPSYPGRWVPDWDALMDRHVRAVGDDASGERTVVLRLPGLSFGVDTLATVYDEANNGPVPTLEWRGRNIVARMPRDTAIYGKLRLS